MDCSRYMFNESVIAICKGFEIFEILNNCDIKLSDKHVSIEDKKIISIYLGLINTKNEFSDLVSKYNLSCNIKVYPKHLNAERYDELRNNEFKNLLDTLTKEELVSSILLAKKIIPYDIINKLSDRNSSLLNIIKNVECNKALVKHI